MIINLDNHHVNLFNYLAGCNLNLMTNDFPGIYCQNCFTWNQGEREICRKCGIRLMIVVGDQSWEEETLVEIENSLNEHILERITNLEEIIRRIETYLETVSDQLGRLERSEVMLRNGLMSLVQEMEHSGQLDSQAFSTRWEQLVEENLQLIIAREIFTRYRARILPIAKPKAVSQLRRALLETSTILDNGLLIEATARLSEALKLDPDNYELMFTVASLKNVAQMWDDAEKLTRNVVKLSPRHYEGWMLLAKILQDDIDRSGNAINTLHIAIQLRPDEAAPRIQLAELLLANGRFQEATKSAQEAVALQKDGETLGLLAEILLAQDEAHKAITILKEASSFLPGDARIRELLAESYIMANEPSKAKAILYELLQQHPNDHDLMLLLDTNNKEQLYSAKGGNYRSRSYLDEADNYLADGNLTGAEVALSKAGKENQSERLEWLKLLLAFRKDPKRINDIINFISSNHHPRLCFQALHLALDYFMSKKDEHNIISAINAFKNAHPTSSGIWETSVIYQTYRLINHLANEDDLHIVHKLQTNPIPGQEARARNLLGQYLLEFKHYNELIKLVDPIISIEPTIINHFQLGSALLATNQYEESLIVLKNGLEASYGDLPKSQAELLKNKIKNIINSIKINADHN